MDKIWIIMSGIVYSVGFAVTTLTAGIFIFNEGVNKTVDKIRNYILMRDDEEDD